MFYMIEPLLCCKSIFGIKHVLTVDVVVCHFSAKERRKFKKQQIQLERRCMLKVTPNVNINRGAQVSEFKD